MSLIFEALKKLDREKKTPERGFLVVGGAPVEGGRHLSVPLLVTLLAVAGGAGFLAARGLRPAPVPPAQHASPATLAERAVPRLTAPAPMAPEARASAAPAPAAAAPSAAEPITPPAAPPVTAPAVTPAPEAAPAAAAPAAPAFALQAVADQDGRPVAIVNGQLVRVGDRVDGARVVRIEPEEVELEHDGRRLVLTF